jgi:hypothetical protein
LARLQAVSGKCWNSPAVSDGRFYVRSTSQAACYDLSIPDLRVSGLLLAGGKTLQLNIGTANGTPLSSSRLTGIQVLASTDLGLPAAQWTKLSNTLTLSNGIARVDELGLNGSGQCFFRVVESQ